MTTEQTRRAKALVEHAAVNGLETEEIQLLGWALQRIAELEGAVIDARNEGMHLAAKGILEVRAKPPKPTLGAKLDPSTPAHVKIQGIWMDAGEVRKAARGLGMVELEAGCVVVPELTEADIDAIWRDTEDIGDAAREMARWAYRLAVSRVRAIPASRVLGEGQVAMDRLCREIADLSLEIRKIEEAGYPDDTRHYVRINDRRHEALTELDALRAQAGKDGAT